MSLSYEEQRRQNIAENEALLKSLGLATPSINRTRPALTKSSSNSSIRKRQRPTSNTNTNTKPKDDVTSPSKAIAKSSSLAEAVTPRKARKLDSFVPDTPYAQTSSSAGSTLRRSTRSSASVRKNYADDGTAIAIGRGAGSPIGKDGKETLARARMLGRGEDGFIDDVDDDDAATDGRIKMRNNESLGVRTQDPKQYGHIPGVEVGRWWATRQECSTDAIHAPFVAGISGNPIDGAYSVALSGGYPDDVDLGSAFTYTGCGGRDLKGTKQNPKNLRTAPQTTHQTFENPMNAALKRSAETRNPVRVIRGFKLPSIYAPAEGYRYDGLYIVEKAWMAKGLTNGLLVCRYAFKRVAGQGELPIKAGDENEDENEGEGAEREANEERDGKDGEEAKVDAAI